MAKISTKEVKQYWEDGDYTKIQKYDMNDFCRMWALEEGISLPANFSVTQNNSKLFTKINSEKHTMNLILDKFNYPIIETESLTFDMECAIHRATQLFNRNGHGVIRANKMAGGGGTFIIKKSKSIPMMISTLLHNPKGVILPLYSPYYEIPIEYGVFMINGKIELVIEKKKNPNNELHNLTLGAKAKIVTDERILQQLENLCYGLPEIFGNGFKRWDIAKTKNNSLRFVEGSVPNFKKFSLQDKKCMESGKELFLKYYQTFYK